MKILREESYFYTLSQDETSDEYFLEVTCGTIAIYEVRVKLTEREKEQFHENPDSIVSLAYRILDRPDSFLNRKI